MLFRIKVILAKYLDLLLTIVVSYLLGYLLNIIGLIEQNYFLNIWFLLWITSDLIFRNQSIFKKIFKIEILNSYEEKPSIFVLIVRNLFNVTIIADELCILIKGKSISDYFFNTRIRPVYDAKARENLNNSADDYDGKVARLAVLTFMVFILSHACLIYAFNTKVKNNKSTILTTKEYIKQEIFVDVSGCNIEIDNDGHGGFLGDGDYYVKLDCSNDYVNINNQIKEWKQLPLTNNLDYMMYDREDTENITYVGDGIANVLGIPKIKNGYYKFIDRHREAVDPTNDSALFDRYSYNFTLALYDLDTNILYYYELDT